MRSSIFRMTAAVAMACLFLLSGLAQAADTSARKPSSLLGRSRTTRPQPPTPPLSGGRTSDPGASNVDPGGRSIEFNGAALDIVLMVYGNLVGKTVLKDPATPAASITLQPQQGQVLSDEDKILAIETVLEMNGIHLEPYGEKFVRALPRGTVRKDGIPLVMDPEAELGETTKVVSMMLSFQNIALDEAQKALEGLKSDKGVLNVFERTGTILVTDTEMNLNRMREIAKKIDVPTPVTENVFVRQIKYATAADVKTALEAIVQESQKELEKQGKSAQTVQQNQMMMPFRPGFNRMQNQRQNQNQQQAQTTTANQSLVTSVSDADRGMIRGKVLILSDERSNKLIIVTAKTNMDFFDKVIEQLDVETTPDIEVKVYRLKYADAEDVSDMINDLIGNAASSKSSSKNNQNQNAAAGANQNMTRGSTTRASVNQRSGEAKTGELSKDNTTVLADKRINGLVVMTNKELVPTVEKIIESMDVKLSQVLIETVIIEVQLGDGIATGIDWVHGMTGGYKDANGSQRYKQAMGGGGNAGNISNIASNLVGSGANALAFMSNPGGAGLTYGIFSDRLNMGAVVQASKTDSHSKYIASPVIMTVDNKEATIEATQMRYLFKGYQYSGSTYNGSAVPDYEQKELGMTVKVTPKINPNGTVMLEVEEEYSQEGAGQDVDGVNQATTVTRKMSADILLDNQQTVVLGGLTETRISTSETGIPILKDIPWIGKYLFGSTNADEDRSEILVFMTPYVMNDGDEAEAEALRRKKSLSDARPWEDNGWSASKLADPVSKKEQLRRLKDEAKKQDEEHETRREMDKWKLKRVQDLQERAEKEQAEDRRVEESRRTSEEDETQPTPLLSELQSETETK